MQRAILSPHLDDAVLSCWHLLEGPDSVTVVNVFTGSPPQGAAVPWWDRLTGATDVVQRMHDRREEDGRALKMTGRQATALDLLDDQYRRSPLPAWAVLERLEAALRPGTVVSVPAAIDGHPDHVLVRDAALALARRGWQVEIYADLPHAITRGWPAWVTGEPGCSDTEAKWTRTLVAAGLDVERLVPHVRPLDAATRERKLRALAEYATQRPVLDQIAFAPLDDPRALGWETWWEVPASALGDGCLQPLGEPIVAHGSRKSIDDRS